MDSRRQGVIGDTSGEVMPGVSIILKNDETNVEVTKASNSEGRYLFDYVDPGTYTLTADMRGFKKLIPRNILVQQRGDVTADSRWNPGEHSPTSASTSLNRALPIFIFGSHSGRSSAARLAHQGPVWG